MSGISQIKTQLLEVLWLPKIRRAGDILYSKLRKNKKMKVLTLTDHRNFQEITTFEESKLTLREHVTAWTYGHIEKLRLETELSPARVFGPTRYEDSISKSSFSLRAHFPFDVINLDFSSQTPDLESGRIEKEIECLERTIKLQRAHNNRGFVIIYTTLLNSNNLDYGSMVNSSNALHSPGWSGIVSGSFPPSVEDQREKIECMESILTEICSKYNYDVEFERRSFSMSGTQHSVCSIAGLLRAR